MISTTIEASIPPPFSTCQRASRPYFFLVPEPSCPVGAKTETFTVMLEPILDHMDALKVAQAHRSAVLPSHLSDKARQATSKVNFANSLLCDSTA